MTSTYDALLLDLSGVLYDGDTIIPGARETVAAARDKGLILRFVTNTATKPAATLIADMQRMQIDIRSDEIFTAPMAALSYLQQHGHRPYLLLHHAIRHEFAALDQRDPDCVVLGDAHASSTAFASCSRQPAEATGQANRLARGPVSFREARSARPRTPPCR